MKCLVSLKVKYHSCISPLQISSTLSYRKLQCPQYGRASSRRVLNAQNSLFNAQNAATEALVKYTVATLNFYRDTGVLQVQPDGMWQY
jgi:hypothetical protein